jgi:hypothetical protein
VTGLQITQALKSDSVSAVDTAELPVALLCVWLPLLSSALAAVAAATIYRVMGHASVAAPATLVQPASRVGQSINQNLYIQKLGNKHQHTQNSDTQTPP